MSSTFELVVKILASISASVMCLTPAPSIYHIHKHKDTGDFSVLPLASQLAYNHIWMLYGFLTQEIFPLLVTYAIGSILSIVFLRVFFVSSIEQQYVRNVIFLTLACNITTTLYASFVGPTFQSVDQLTQAIGVIAIASGFALYASPFATIKTVFHTRSSASIPITMVVVGTISNTLWIIYGFLIPDYIIIIPTIINAFLGLFQISLYAIFHPCIQKSRQKENRFIHFGLNPDPNNLEHTNASEFQCDFSKISLESPQYNDFSFPCAIAV